MKSYKNKCLLDYKKKYKTNQINVRGFCKNLKKWVEGPFYLFSLSLIMYLETKLP